VLRQLLYNLGIIVIVALIVMYIMYSVGLAKVFIKLGEIWWKAFIPLYNFKKLISILNLPKKWFVLSLTPYLGTIYSVAVAYRLGRVFGKGLAYSSVWLIIGSPIGMLQIGFTKKPMHLDVLKEPAPRIKDLQNRLLKKKKPDQK
jgi:hypothetical protein